MGLKSFSGDVPTKKDISIAKNYLDEKELKIRNILVSGFFDFAEIQAIEHVPMYMRDYIEQLDRNLSSDKRKLLEDSGSISHRLAVEKAEKEYHRYQDNTLSPVEKAYLNTLQAAEKEAKKKK